MGLDILWTVYAYLPEAILIDLLVLQAALRVSFYRSRRKSSRSSRSSGAPAPAGSPESPKTTYDASS